MTKNAIDKFTEQYNRQWAELNAADAAAKAKGELVGRYITHQYADGNAVYKINRVSGNRVSLSVVEIGDAWILPAWGAKPTLALTQVKQFLAQRDAVSALFQKSKDFYADLEPGLILHYHDSFNRFIRCEVVRTPEGMKLKPIALVGDWREYDLPHWTAWGEPDYPYHVKKIREGEAWQPHESNIYEAMKDTRRFKDPRNLPALSLELPERTSEEIEQHAICAKWNAVRKALDVDYAKGDTHAAAMERARKLLQD